MLSSPPPAAFDGSVYRFNRKQLRGAVCGLEVTEAQTALSCRARLEMQGHLGRSSGPLSPFYCGFRERRENCVVSENLVQAVGLGGRMGREIRGRDKCVSDHVA